MQERHERALVIAAEAVSSLYGERLVSFAVFGSMGRGTAHDHSDVDLLIVATELPRGRVARATEFAPVEHAVAQACPDAPLLSPIFKTPDELRQGSPLLLDMVDDARVLFDRDRVLATELARLADRLRELGSRRIWRDGWWYWDQKPDFRPGEVFTL